MTNLESKEDFFLDYGERRVEGGLVTFVPGGSKVVDDLGSPNPSSFDGSWLLPCIFKPQPLVPHRLLGFWLSLSVPEKNKHLESGETTVRLLRFREVSLSLLR